MERMERIERNKRFFYFHDILIELIIKRGERMRKLIVLISMLIPMGICRIWCEQRGVGKLRYHGKPCE